MTERISRSRLINIPLGEYQAPRPDEIFSFAQSALAKQRARTRLLKENPEAVISIDPQPLRNIIPESALVCYTGSSVARNRAIRGSDIDGAIVVSHVLPDLEQQRNYTLALRKQGFKVYSPEQIAKLETSELLIDKPQKLQDIAFKVISFETFDDFKRNREEGIDLVHARFFVLYADDAVDS